MLAILQDELEMMKLFIRHGADPFATKNGETTLHYAASANKPTSVALLLRLGLPIESKDGQQRTALHLAAK